MKKIQKWIETINTYYAFALIVYAAAVFASGYSHIVWWSLVVVTPLLAGWTGFLLKSILDRRNLRHGFHTISAVMSYEIGKNHRYRLYYAATLKAGTDHLMVYPIGYQWSGSGPEGIPKLADKRQQLLAPALPKKKGVLTPYKATVSTEGDWQYWFIALNPPVHKDETVQVKYSQVFHDRKGRAKPYLYYFVRTPMQKLELSVKFPADKLPRTVTSSIIKPSDPSRPYLKPGVLYEPEKQWATWIIHKPKKGYCYRLHWQ